MQDERVLCQPMYNADLKKRLINPKNYNTYKNHLLPGNNCPLNNNQFGVCNTYVPSQSTWARFLWTVQVFVSQGFYVVIDYQPQVCQCHNHAGKQAFQILLSRMFSKTWLSNPRFHQQSEALIFKYTSIVQKKEIGSRSSIIYQHLLFWQRDNVCFLTSCTVVQTTE